MRVERIGVSEWADALPDTGFEVFHLPSALEVLDEHGDGELELLAGFKGQQPVGLLPTLVQDRRIGRTVLSPPPSLGVPRLGPVLMPTSPKRRKREKVNREFTELVLDELDVDATTTLFRMVCNGAYADPRPYVWADLDLETAFTYRLDVSGTNPEELRRSFSKSLRREIRDAEELDVVVETEGLRGARAVYEETRARYEEQDRGFPMPWEYVRDLVTALDERCRVYVLRDPEGRFLAGITVLYSNDVAYFWQGGARTVHEGVSVNSLLHWRILEDLIADPPVESVTGYDLMGANTERLCRYKAKFGGDLVPYYTVESAGKHVDVAKKAYLLLHR